MYLLMLVIATKIVVATVDASVFRIVDGSAVGTVCDDGIEIC